MSSWNKRHDSRLHKFEKLILRQIRLNKLAAEYYERRSEWFGYPTVVIGAIATATSPLFTNSKTDDDLDYISYISGGLTLLMTILTGFKTISKYEQKSNSHRNAVSVFNKLAKDIDTQKDLEYKDREPVDTFMKYIKDKFSDLDESTPDIPLHIEKKLNEGFDKWIRDLKASGELSESSEQEEEKFETKKVQVLNEETGEHVLTEIVIQINPDEEETEEKSEGRFLMRSIEKQIDSLTDNNFCNNKL